MKEAKSYLILWSVTICSIILFILSVISPNNFYFRKYHDVEIKERISVNCKYSKLKCIAKDYNNKEVELITEIVDQEEIEEIKSTKKYSEAKFLPVFLTLIAITALIVASISTALTMFSVESVRHYNDRYRLNAANTITLYLWYYFKLFAGYDKEKIQPVYEYVLKEIPIYCYYYTFTVLDKKLTNC